MLSFVIYILVFISYTHGNDTKKGEAVTIYLYANVNKSPFYSIFYLLHYIKCELRKHFRNIMRIIWNNWRFVIVLCYGWRQELFWQVLIFYPIIFVCLGIFRTIFFYNSSSIHKLFIIRIRCRSFISYHTLTLEMKIFNQT